MSARKLLLAAGFLTVVASAGEIETLGRVSFVPPDGWRFKKTGVVAAEMTVNERNRQIGLGIYNAIRSTGDMETDFRVIWEKSVGPISRRPKPDTYSHDSLAGYSGRTGCARSGGLDYVCLHLLRFVGNIIVPVVEVFSSLDDKDPYSTAISLFLDGIRVDPERAEPIKRRLEMTDLTGEWHTSSESSAIYVDAAGNYAGTSFVAHGTGYVIASDGTYTSSFVGIGNGQILREKERGVVEIQTDLVTFRNAENNHTEQYRWISTQKAPNGSSVITLMPSHYAATGVNVRFYGEKLIRAAPRE